MMKDAVNKTVEKAKDGSTPEKLEQNWNMEKPLKKEELVENAWFSRN